MFAEYRLALLAKTDPLCRALSDTLTSLAYLIVWFVKKQLHSYQVPI